MFWLSGGEEIMTLAFFVLIQYRSVTDGRTDIPPLAIPAVCIARYANALVKMLKTHALLFLWELTAVMVFSVHHYWLVNLYPVGLQSFLNVHSSFLAIGRS